MGPSDESAMIRVGGKVLDCVIWSCRIHGRCNPKIEISSLLDASSVESGEWAKPCSGCVDYCGSRSGPRPGPGTRLKNFLENHGVTEEWYRNLKEKVGLVPECNCEMRRRYLDECWAAWQAGGWKSAKIAYDRVKEYYAKPR